MLLVQRSRPRRFRSCRSFLPPFLETDRLESRTLLSSIAVIQWSMAPQIAPDPAHGNAPDLPNTPEYVNPPGGYNVLLDASHSVGILPGTTFSWTVTNPGGQATSLSGEHPNINLPQATYSVRLTATGLSGKSRPVSTSTKVQVKDVLIVSIGDSYASGEGNPVVPSATAPQWAYSPDPAMNTENADAHRSTIAGAAQFALQLQQSNPHEAVTFVSVAASGASIPDGILGPMPSIGDPTFMLPAQISELEQIIGSRHIDVLTVTVGGDDIGFTPIIQNLISNTYSGTPTLQAIQSQFDTALGQLPAHYAALDQAIQTLAPSQVLITQYPDITRNQKGQPATIFDGLILIISKADDQFAAEQIIPPLNAAIASAASTYNWTLVTGLTTDFRTHGYPSTSSWIRSVPASLAMEGSVDGSFHPNALGHLDIARHLLAAYKTNLRKLG